MTVIPLIVKDARTVFVNLEKRLEGLHMKGRIDFIDFFLFWLFYSVIWHFPRFIISMAHFSLLNFIAISLLYILTTRGSISFSFLVNNLISSMYIIWLIFSCDLWSL